MNQKGISSILIILIIVGVLVLAGGVWYWQNQKDETLNWKTYRNEEYGFEVKYPENLAIKDLNAGSVIENPIEIGFLEPDRQTFFYSLTIIDKNEPRQMSNFSDNPECYKESSQNINLDPKLKTIILGNKKWESFYYTCGSGEAPEPLHFILKEDNFIIEVVPFDDSYENVIKILSTFKFINTGESDDLGTCNVDSDCACGRKIGTNECFFGNKKYVNTASQCPDFCTGIDGKMRIKCVNNVCTPVR